MQASQLCTKYTDTKRERTRWWTRREVGRFLLLTRFSRTFRDERERRERRERVDTAAFFSDVQREFEASKPYNGFTRRYRLRATRVRVMREKHG